MFLQTRRGVARLSCLVCLTLGLVQVSPVRGAMITLGPGVMNPPPPLTSIVPETAVADTAQLVPSANFNAILAATLTAQGYTAANNWVYSFNSPPLPAGLVNPVALPANATFNITAYNLYLNPPMTAFGELFDFTLINPPANPVLAGATITPHWIQLINESQRLAGGTFGFAIAGQPGFWALDNGFVVGAAGGANRGAVGGTGPYYDSNAPAGGFSVPPTYHDSPQFFSAQTGTTYLHFTTIPAWDVSVGGNNYIIVGDTGITWGFTIVPEPSTNTLMIVGIVLISIVARFQRTFARTRAA